MHNKDEELYESHNNLINNYYAKENDIYDNENNVEDDDLMDILNNNNYLAR